MSSLAYAGLLFSMLKNRSFSKNGDQEGVPGSVGGAAGGGREKD